MNCCYKFKVQKEVKQHELRKRNEVEEELSDIEPGNEHEAFDLFTLGKEDK